MKVFAVARMLVLLVIGLMLTCVPVSAQNLVLSVTTSTNSVVVSNSVTYTISLTNQTAILLNNVFITNAPSALVLLLGATNVQGSFFNDGSVLVFTLVQLVGGGFAQMTMTVAPTTNGLFTNTVTVGSFPLIATNFLTTNVVVTATAPQGDLAVGISGPSLPLFVGDLFVYGTSVTNLGPAIAQNVILTNKLPAGVGVISVSPANPPFTRTNGVLTFNLGALTNGAVRTFSLSVQATNSGNLSFLAGVSGTGFVDTNPTNNTASNNVIVSDFSGQLIATNSSTMTFNPQTGLMEQTITLSNIGTNSVAAARVIVSGLTNQLYNSVGTNNGNPFVLYSSTLDINQSVNLVLEYFIPTRLSITVTNYVAVGVSTPNLTAPSNPGTPVQITRIIKLASGRMLIEFPSILGRTYTVIYSDGLQTTGLMAQPFTVAPANEVQWIDYGPPGTISHPNDSPSRFYRVYLNP